MPPPSYPQSETAPEDKVALSQKLLYSAATVALIPGMQIIERIAQVVLNICLGINPTLIGVGIAIFRIWDAFTDPFLGNLSDNCRSKWGRRRPFIVVGGVLCALTFPLMWLMSRDWTPVTAFLYFVGAGLAYSTALTIYSVPCRREGSFTAILTSISKVGFALAVLLSGLILDLSGFDVNPGKDQPRETLLLMRALFVFFPIAMAAGMLLLIRFYPLDDRRCHEIRLELEARRGELHGTEKV